MCLSSHASLLVIYLLVGMNCAEACIDADKRQVMKALAIDPGMLSYISLEVPSCSNIRVLSNEVSFILDAQNQKIHGGVRSEVAIDYPFNEGDTVEYRWSLLLPSANPPGADAGAWWLLAQWHDQPDRRKGETWLNFKSQPPPFAVVVEKRDGVVGIGMNGLSGRIVSWVPVTLDQWLDFTATVRWSTGIDGSVVVRIEGHPEIKFEMLGRNMHNGFQHYFKFGQYRAPWVNSVAAVRFREVKIVTKSAKSL